MTLEQVTKSVDAGAARSIKEIREYLAGRECPTCHSAMVWLWGERGQGAGDHAYTARMHCERCETLWDYRFRAGPGWDRQPDDDDPRFAAGDAPSTLVDAERFRETLDRAIRKIGRLERPPAGAEGEELSEWQDRVLSLSREGLGALWELRKLARAAGRAEDGDLAAAERTLSEQLMEAGGTLPRV